jgi:hypothetical protein
MAATSLSQHQRLSLLLLAAALVGQLNVLHCSTYYFELGLASRIWRMPVFVDPRVAQTSEINLVMAMNRSEGTSK